MLNESGKLDLTKAPETAADPRLQQEDGGHAQPRADQDPAATCQGIREMNRLPDAMVVVDPKREHIAVKEAQRMGVTTVALIDTDSDPDTVDLPIPGNDDSIRSIELILAQAGRRRARRPAPPCRRSSRRTAAAAPRPPPGRRRQRPPPPPRTRSRRPAVVAISEVSRRRAASRQSVR